MGKQNFLNYYGIDTEKENKGIFANESVPEKALSYYHMLRIQSKYGMLLP